MEYHCDLNFRIISEMGLYSWFFPRSARIRVAVTMVESCQTPTKVVLRGTPKKLNKLGGDAMVVTTGFTPEVNRRITTLSRCIKSSIKMCFTNFI